MIFDPFWRVFNSQSALRKGLVEATCCTMGVAQAAMGVIVLGIECRRPTELLKGIGIPLLLRQCIAEADMRRRAHHSGSPYVGRSSKDVVEEPVHPINPRNGVPRSPERHQRHTSSP